MVYSDQKSLRHLLQQRITTVYQHNWLAKLLGYQFEIIYKPGPDNKEDGELQNITSFPVCTQEQQLQ